MFQAGVTTKRAIIAQQQRVDIIANNVSNINTTGFKAQRADFKDTLYSYMVSPNAVQRGTGTALSGTVRAFGQGVRQETGQTLDFMITGDAFFTLIEGGEHVYTRNGAFYASHEQGTSYLVDSSGRYVADENGERIALPDDLSGLSVDPDGTLRSNEVPFAKLGLSAFANKEGLIMQNGCYRATEASGEAIAANAEVSQGCLEASNTDLAREMTELIKAQRALSLAGRAFMTADEMDRMANNLRA